MRFLLVTGNLEPRNWTIVSVVPQLCVILIDNDMLVILSNFNNVGVGFVGEIHDMAVQSVDLELPIFEPSVPTKPIGRTRIAHANATLSVPTSFRHTDCPESWRKCNEI